MVMDQLNSKQLKGNIICACGDNHLIHNNSPLPDTEGLPQIVLCDMVMFLPLMPKPKLKRSRCYGELVLTSSNRTLQRTYRPKCLQTR